MQQLHLRLTSGHGWCATGEFQWRQQFLDRSQLHLPCRCGNSSALVQVQAGDNYTIEKQSSSFMSDPSRCSVRKSSTRHSCPQNRRVVQPQMPREPVWMVRTINFSKQCQHLQQMII